MRKVICLSLAFVLLLSSFVFAEPVRDNPKLAVQEFVEVISQSGDFVIWSEGKLSQERELFNTDGKVSAYLYNILDKDHIIGYLLVDVDSYKVIEYALGQSPYDDYLSQYKEKNKAKFKLGNNKLIYAGPSKYGISVTNEEGKEEIIDFINDPNTQISIDTTKHARELRKETQVSKTKNSEIVALGYISERIIPGVYDFTWYIGCGPTAGANIVYYWKDRGYSNLVPSGKTGNDIIAALAAEMGTTGQLTLPDGFSSGLQKYFDRYYQGTFTVDINISNKTFDFVYNEVQSNRPGTVLYMDHPDFGWHYVTYVGYQKVMISSGYENYYVIHDTWAETPVNVYRLWDEDAPWIEVLYPVRSF